MRRVLRLTVATLLLGAAVAAPALGHSSFVGSTPAPGQRLAVSPQRVVLKFSEHLNDRLSTATVTGAANGHPVGGVTRRAAGSRVVLRVGKPLLRGAYRVRWHTVSTEDGHALEGSYSFGVRAVPVGGRHDVEQSPFAREGWLRVPARALMFAAVLLFAGALILDAVLSRGREPWLAPAALAADAPGFDLAGLAQRHRRLLVDVGLLAAGAAALSAGADAADAAGGVSARGLSDFLLSNGAGLTRVYTVLLLLLASALAALRIRIAAVAGLGALAAISLSGHANASAPRGLAVANDWLHLAAAATWLGGIAMLVLLWGPRLRTAQPAARIALARHVLRRFGRVALPAFGAVVATGGVSAVIELGDLRALFDTDYGRVLVIKTVLVATIAAMSYWHALRLRPRILNANPHPEEHVERRHWQLLRVEPLVSLGVVGAVALLVAFPLPPRHLGDADQAIAAPLSACAGCPLPTPAADELAVAEQGGSDVVAAWVRRTATGLAGTVRLYGLSHNPARDPFTIIDASQRSCGTGCAHFAVPGASDVLRVEVRQRGRTYLARLPVRWQQRQRRRARRLVHEAQTAMRALRSAREVERVSSVPRIYAVTHYKLKAPDRMAFRTNGQVVSVVLGRRQWTRGQRDAPWQRSPFGGGLPFRTRSWFTWTTYARHVYLLGERATGSRRLVTVALMDPGTPAWWRLTIDTATRRVVIDRLVTYGHFMTQRFSAFNRSLQIEPPEVTAYGR